MSQIRFEINEENQAVLVESRTLRDQYVYNDAVLEKVKAIPSLPGTVELTLEIAASFYDVPVETVKTVVKRNREEFNEYGEMRVLKGKALSEFKTQVQDELELGNTPSITLINRRGLLRIGMLLTESEVAKTVRHYLLNVEETAPEQTKRWAVEREIARRERRQMTDAIRDFYEVVVGSKADQYKYSTFTNLVYRLLFETDAAGLRKMYSLDKDDPLRDSMSTEDLRKIVGVEQAIATLIKLGWDYAAIRDELEKNKRRFTDAS